MAYKTKIQHSDVPFNIEAEKTVLGSALTDKNALYDIIGSLSEDCFYDLKNQTVFKAFISLQEKKIPVDVQTTFDELLNLKELDNIGGVDYLKELVDSAISLSNLQFYIRILQDQAVCRNMLIEMRAIDKEYKTEQIEDVNAFVANAEARLTSISKQRTISDFISAPELTKRVKESMAMQQVAPDDNVTGVTTGYTDLNRYLHGFQKSDLVILAARPSVGKTALALNLAYNAARKENKTVAIFSLEMPADLLTKRIIANQACVDFERIQTGHTSTTDKVKINQALEELSKTKIFIDDSSSPTILDIIAKSRKLQAAHPDLALIVVDYIGLINGGKKYPSKQEEIQAISRQLKGLAMELKVPVLVLCQLSRDVEKRDSKRPELGDLRDSGAIEQDADQVLLMYREDYYTNRNRSTIKNSQLANKKGSELTDDEQASLNNESKKTAYLESLGEGVSPTEVIIAKNRNGRSGITVDLLFFTQYGRFDNPTEEYLEITRNLRRTKSFGGRH